MAKPDKIVGYRRTSTEDQLLGIEAQDKRIDEIATDKKCPIVRVFTEHESGGDNARPELAKALAHAGRVGAYFVVAKLDRLARDATFLMQIYDSRVPVIFGDLPEVDGSAAGRLMVQMMANIAEFERRRIGERTREALAVLKARGGWHAKKSGRWITKLGTPANLTHEARLKGARQAALARTAKAVQEMADVAPVAARLSREGWSLRQIADHLNGEGYVTRRGKSWTATQVKRVLDRIRTP